MLSLSVLSSMNEWIEAKKKFTFQLVKLSFSLISNTLSQHASNTQTWHKAGINTNLQFNHSIQTTDCVWEWKCRWMFNLLVSQSVCLVLMSIAFCRATSCYSFDLLYCGHGCKVLQRWQTKLPPHFQINWLNWGCVLNLSDHSYGYTSSEFIIAAVQVWSLQTRIFSFLITVLHLHMIIH